MNKKFRVEEIPLPTSPAIICFPDASDAEIRRIMEVLNKTWKDAPKPIMITNTMPIVQESINLIGEDAPNGTLFVRVKADYDIRIDKRNKASCTCMGDTFRIGGRNQRECRHIKDARKKFKRPRKVK